MPVTTPMGFLVQSWQLQATLEVWTSDKMAAVATAGREVACERVSGCAPFLQGAPQGHPPSSPG